ncbi:unnamed protein product [Meloidogyne enterolobii]|uniref:Uncharacterized protein n=1 Tax=Meloidogyne enterolobii TaxID=390850 RepID=A0ACB0Y327_MELEN
MFMLWKNCGWEMELNHHGKSPNRSTTDCATIQPNAGLFIFIYILSASADTTIANISSFNFKNLKRSNHGDSL